MLVKARGNESRGDSRHLLSSLRVFQGLAGFPVYSVPLHGFRLCYAQLDMINTEHDGEFKQIKTGLSDVMWIPIVYSP